MYIKYFSVIPLNKIQMGCLTKHYLNTFNVKSSLDCMFNKSYLLCWYSWNEYNNINIYLNEILHLFSQYRHSAPYVGPPQQYAVQPPGSGTFYPGHGPGEYPAPYGKFRPLYSAHFSASVLASHPAGSY